MCIEIDYKPTPKQALFHSSPAYEVLYGGAAGGGKSKAIVMEAFIDALEHENVDAYLFRRTYPELRDTLIREAILSIPPELGRFNKSTHDMRLINGSTLHFRHCRNLADAYAYQGAEMHRLYIDELTHFEKPVYDYLRTRVRAPKRLGIKPYIRATTNPGGVGHGWVKSAFIDGKEPFKIYDCVISSEVLGKSRTVTRQYIPATALDNPHIGDEYIFELEQKPEALRRALLSGDWDVFEGQVFTEWRDIPQEYISGKGTHVIEPFKIPDHWKRYRSFDWGYSRPFSVGYWAEDDEGKLYRYAEIYGSPKDRFTGLTKTPNEGMRLEPGAVAAIIKDYEDAHEQGRRIIGIADPAIFDESRGSDGSVAKIFERKGIYFEKADNKRIAGKMQVHYRLAFDQNNMPRLYVFNTCRDFIRTMPALVYSSVNVEDIDTDGEDHIYDETRYMCMYRPVLPLRTKQSMAREEFDPLNLHIAAETSGYKMGGI